MSQERGFGKNVPVVRFYPRGTLFGNFLGWVSPDEPLEIMEHYHPWDSGSGLDFGLNKPLSYGLDVVEEPSRVPHLPVVGSICDYDDKPGGLMALSNIAVEVFCNFSNGPDGRIAWPNMRTYLLWQNNIAGVLFYVAIPIELDPPLNSLIAIADMVIRQRDFAFDLFHKHQHGVANTVVRDAAKRPAR